jgi:hypothetical protein
MTRERVRRGLRTTASVALFGFALLLFLITFAIPREDGEIGEPGFVVLCYILPVIGMVAAAALSPGATRRAWIPLTTALTSCGGWLVLFFRW